MLSLDIERELEAATVALNEWLFAEGAGLPADPAGYEAPAARLSALYDELVATSPDATVRAFALESAVEVRRVALDVAVSAALDAAAKAPDLAGSEGALTWRNWKTFEREAAEARELQAGFEGLVAASAGARPALAARLSANRREFAAHGTTPVHIFAAREGVEPGALRAVLEQGGQAARPGFASALDALSRRVFGRPAGPAELHALYLNCMYTPGARLFDAAGAVPLVLRAFTEMGFNLQHVAVDLERRPRKYPGAFCLPVRIPQDVRVSVRPASAHHLVDMLFHEFGHAAHFSGIQPDLPFIDRYWIHSGTHETFSSLFEHLLGERDFLRGWLGLDEAETEELLDFARFKLLLTATWLGASALTALETWLDGLDWEAVEDRYASNFRAFTGVAVPAGLARLEPFAAAATIYPAGYVLAAVRLAHWVPHLRGLGGAAWWKSPEAQADIRRRIGAGGAGPFPPEWVEPGKYLAQLTSG